MFRSIVLLALLGLAIAFPRGDSQRPRIVNGNPISIEHAAYQAAIEVNGEQVCGGAIVSPKLILTAAHCFQGVDANNLKVRVGSKDRMKGGQLVSAANLFKHPSNVGKDYDLGVIELAESLTFGATINSIPLPAKDEPVETNSEGLVTGWGFDKELVNGGKPSDLLLGTKVPIASRMACKAVHPNFKDNMICAGSPFGGYGPCNGDWGGPLVVNGKLVGIASFGVGCARPNYPAVYQYVAKSIDFITEHV